MTSGAQVIDKDRSVESGELVFSTRNREAWSLFSAKLVVTPSISANLRSAALTNALRCRRTVSVCVFKRAKRGRFAYFSLKLALIRLTQALREPSGTGPIRNRQ
jgi:hypothetical protein